MALQMLGRLLSLSILIESLPATKMLKVQNSRFHSEQ
jgi:hypothetical protein